MSLLVPVVRRRPLPDLTMYVEITTVGMKVTCRVIEEKGRITITREMFWIEKSKHNWFKFVEEFYKIACEHYPKRNSLFEVANTHKEGS